MFSTLRTRFGIPGAISVIALVFAMLGGAYAASNSSGGKATASAKSKRGPRGPKGATGPAGPAGPQGAAGANGKDGSNGSNGATGATGTAGQSVTSTPIPPEGECGEQEGVKLHSASGDTAICNGANGEKGDEGSPWTLGGTLPSGKTETGAWSVVGSELEGPLLASEAISFPIPLASALGGSSVHFIKRGASIPTGCTGGTAAAPKAAPGNLCVYVQRGYPSAPGSEETLEILNEPLLGSPGTDTAGAFLYDEEHPESIEAGTWAVTAP